MATNRAPARAQGNRWPDSDTYQRLVGLVVGLKAIADGIVSRFRWSRGAGTTILVTFGEWVGLDTFDGGAVGPLLTLPGDFMQIRSDGGTNWKILASKVAGVPA